MNKKRTAYLLALVLIILAAAIPAALKHSDSKIPASSNEKIKVVSQSSASPQASANNPEETVNSASGSKPNPAEKQECKVAIAVVGDAGKLLYAPKTVAVESDNKWGITPLGALEATGLSYKMKTAWPDFVDSIGEQTSHGVSGWMFMVNGEIPMHMANKHPLKEGDQVIWWYSTSMDQEPPVWNTLLKKQN